MSLRDFQQMLTTVPKSVVINFGGFTESAINPMMPKMAQYAYQKGHPIEVFTTLIGLNETGMETLSKIRIDKFCVHVPDSYNTIYDTDKWLNILRRFKKYRIRGVTYGALGDVDERIVQEIGQDPFFRSYVFNKNKYYVDENEPSKVGRLKCSFNHTGLNIDQSCVATNGDVCICSQDYRMDNILGNLLTQSYSEVMASQIRANFRKRMLTQDETVLCRRCPHGTPVDDKKTDSRYEHQWRS
jgi:radical SAM protein with 4Fe4S-binding SPASM domain